MPSELSPFSTACREAHVIRELYRATRMCDRVITADQNFEVPARSSLVLRR